jgi:hypothetical protein
MATAQTPHSFSRRHYCYYLIAGMTSSTQTHQHRDMLHCTRRRILHMLTCTRYMRLRMPSPVVLGHRACQRSTNSGKLQLCQEELKSPAAYPNEFRQEVDWDTGLRPGHVCLPAQYKVRQNATQLIEWLRSHLLRGFKGSQSTSFFCSHSRRA